MTRTPDRFPTVGEDEGLILSNEGTQPIEIGELRNDGGRLFARDVDGVYPLRPPGSVPAPAAACHILTSLDGSTWESRLPVTSSKGMLVNQQGQLMVYQFRLS